MRRRRWAEFSGIGRACHGIRTIIPAAILAVAGGMDGAAQAPPAPQLPPDVEVRAAARPQKATVGEPIRIDIDITLPAGFQARLEIPGRNIGEFEILESFPGPAVPDADEGRPAGAPPTPAPTRSLHRARLVVAAYRPGEIEFPSPAIQLLDPGGRQTSIAGPAVPITIESVLEQGDAALMDLRRQAEVPEPVPWRLLVLLAALLAAASAAWWWLRARRRRRAEAPPLPVPKTDPLESAEADLRDLIGRGLVEKGQVKQFYVLLSEIVRRILEAAYSIPTMEKTTSELVAGLSGAPIPRPPDAELEKIETFLLGCDMVKFAKYLPAPFEISESIRSAFEILEECRRIRRQPELVAGPVPGGG
ncbi:MAG: hypothetical protein FJW35_11585 [Acidobacteria bacterium]|nr:hypothetical protein [Acidobacteriota bacterium]